MTLDKAIEVYEFWANAHERDAEYHRPLGYSHETIANVAEMQAREERQIAEWLKELKAYRETYPYGVEDYPPRAEPSDSEKPNNCEHITEDGVTCAKYPACDDCLDNPLNKLKGSERLVKGKDEPTHEIRTDTHECVKDTHDKDEPTISKMEQVDKDINVRSKDEPQYDFGEYADRLWKIAYERGKREALEQTEPQTDCKMPYEDCEDCETHLKAQYGDCNKCKWYGDKQVCGRCRSKNLYAPKTEPQTYVINPQEPTNDEKCFECDDFFTCGGQCNKIEDEPQTDCAWK